MAQKKPFLLRLPPDLMDELTRWARDELRSVNAQIEYVLREAVRQRGRRAGGSDHDPQEEKGRRKEER